MRTIRSCVPFDAIRGLFIALALIPLLAVTARAANHVLVCDPSGAPGTFYDAPAAISAAAEGDVILMHPGVYTSISINAKSLTIVGEGAVYVDYIQVFSLKATQSVTVRGVYAQGGIIGSHDTCSVGSCIGPVVFEDCIMKDFFPNENAVARGAAVGNSNRVMFVRCQITGGKGYHGAVSGDGIRAATSTISVYDCIVRGGDGVNAIPPTPPFNISSVSSAGGNALHIDDGLVFASGTTFLGGTGGSGSQTAAGACDLHDSSGGDGILVSGPAEVTLLDSTATGGAIGTVPAGCQQFGQPGVDIDPGAAGIIIPNPDAAHRLIVSSPVRVGQTATVQVAGGPNAPVLLLISLTKSVDFVPALQGTLLPGLPAVAVPLGKLDAAGAMVLNPMVPSNLLPAGMDGLDLNMQIASPGVFGIGILSSPSVLTILAAGF